MLKGGILHVVYFATMFVLVEAADGVNYKVWQDVDCGDKNDDYKATSMVECGAICKSTSFDDKCRIAIYNATASTCSIPQPTDYIVCSPNDEPFPNSHTFYNDDTFPFYFEDYAPHGVYLEMKDVRMDGISTLDLVNEPTLESCIIFCATNYSMYADSVEFHPVSSSCVCTGFKLHLLYQMGKSLGNAPGWTLYDRIY